jgi:general secretion pathway protein G
MLLHKNEEQRRIDRIRRVAFTLMEMLVVVAIIVVLAGIGGFAYISIQKTTTARLAKEKAKNIAKACGTYAADHNGAYPPNLETLLTKDTMGFGPYLDSPNMLQDPWGQPYRYQVPGQNSLSGAPDIITTDPETGQPIGNW